MTLTKADDMFLLKYIHYYIRRKGYAPNRREMMDELALSSTSPVNARVQRIIALGWLASEPNIARGIKVTHKGRDAIRKWDDDINNRVSEWRKEHQNEERV